MRQGRWAALFAVMAISTVVAVAAATSGGAAEPEESNRFTVKKVVVGTPTGTEFTVHVTCGNTVTDVTFDANGDPDPSGSNVFEPGATTTCTAVETGTAGASSVSYECDIDFGSTDPNHTLSSCTADNEAHFGDVIHDSATVTITNTFEPATTTTTTTTLAPASSPGIVQVQPTFTG